MIHPDNVNLYDETDRFPPIVNRVFGDGDVWSETPNNVANSRNLSGGCDGCLNWTGMDWLNELPLCNMAFSYPWWPSYRSEPVQYRTDNNKLSTTVMALQWLYLDPSWPPGASNLSASLWSTGKSRADLWQLA